MIRTVGRLTATLLAVGVVLPGCSDDGTTIYIIAGGAGGIGGSDSAGSGGSLSVSGAGGGSSSGGSSSAGSGSGGDAQGGSTGSGGVANGGSSGSGAGSDSGGAAGSAGSPGAGGTSGSAGASGSGGASGSAGAGGSGGAPACNTVGKGLDVFESNYAGYTPPAMTGGQLVDGTYELVAREDYDGSCNCYHNHRFVISGGGTLYLSNLDGNRSNAALSVSGNVLTVTNACPDPGTSSSQTYTATPSEIQLYTADDIRVDYYTRTGP